MSIDTDLYRLIRRLYLVDGLGQREIARRLNVSRCTIRKYCMGAVPPEAKKNSSSFIAPNALVLACPLFCSALSRSYNAFNSL